MMTMLAGAIGNGNTAGVATAIAIGGPGAIFWMWASGLFAMASKYSEAVSGEGVQTKSFVGNGFKPFPTV
jgi:AGCS family alanine or glycine:cation symporter